MSEHKTKSVEGLVTSDAVQRGSRHWFLPESLGIVIGLAVVVAVFGLIGGVLYKIYVYDPAHKKSESGLSHSQTNSNYLLLHPEKQVSAAQTELQNAKSPQEKAAAYNYLGQAYLNNQQPTDAVNALNSSLSADSSTSNKLQALNVLGYAYSSAGQPDKAIATFQQIIAMIQASNDASFKDQLFIYQSAIKEIQQGQTL